MKKIIAALLVFVCLCQLSINTNAVDVSPTSSSDGVTVSVNNSKNVILENSYIAITVNKVVGLTSITDKRTGHEWNLNHAWAATVNSIEVVGKAVKLDILLGSIQKNAYSEITLSETKPEVTVTLSCADNSAMPNGAFYPEPFLTNKETKLIMPKQEGMMVQANDNSYPEFAEKCYAGGFLSMPFYGLIDGDSSMMAIINTPDDATLWLNRKVGSDGLLKIIHQWDPQKGMFGSQRQLTFVFFDSNSIVPMAKRYREEATKLGYCKTLLEKRETNPNIDRLVGAADIWFNLGLAEEKFLAELLDAGFKRFIWNGSAGTELSMSKPTYLSLLDQGILIPRFHSSMIVNPNTTQSGAAGYTPYIYKKAWDKDLVYNQDGSIYQSFHNDASSNRLVEFGYLCDITAIKYVEETQAAQSKIYNANFMDGASNQAYLECYDADHPMTRTESKLEREKWLDACSYGDTMVIGSENGVYNLVPYVDYVEGMMSIGSFRDPEAGGDQFKIVDNPSKALTDYELGQKYRIPLWELVFHDCSVSYWYWGDSSNIYPSFFQKRDLFNILYGTPPLYSMSLVAWNKMKDQFVSSYNNVTPVARAVGYAEMTDFEYLTENMDVQSTTFSNGVKVIVNFGDKDYTDSDGSVIKSMDYKASGIQPEPEPIPSPSPSTTIIPSPSATAAVPSVTASDDEASTNDSSAKVNWILPTVLSAGLIICVLAVLLIYRKYRRNRK
jgi:hypothetical protein